MELIGMTRSAQSRVERNERRWNEVCAHKNTPPVQMIPEAADNETALLMCIAVLLIADGSTLMALAILYIAL